MKIIAFYLPQFHTIAENDNWWGEGFTEWINVKKARPLFKGHSQPEIPLGKRYYNLLDQSVQEKQAVLAKKYGVYGFCYYHYWFEGKLLLEKPMENMLKNPAIDFPFCICWANESWARTWDGKEQEILIAQNYSETKEGWKTHFDYLLPFFRDNRYIKCEDKPLMVIYKPYLFRNMAQMIECWNQWALEAGLKGIYWVYQHPTSFEYYDVIKTFDKGIEFEPLYTEKKILDQEIGTTLYQKIRYVLTHPDVFMNKILHFCGLRPIIYNYDKVWNRILMRTPDNKAIIPGAFVSWDNTARKGVKGTVFAGATPEKFGKYMTERIKTAREKYDSEFVFINAWNEWGEGAHLEPDERNRYGYLSELHSSMNENNEE